MSDQISVTGLLVSLEEACKARGWRMSIDYCGGAWPWEVTVNRREIGETWEGFGSGGKWTLHEALADVWGQIAKHCRAEAARGRAT